MISTRFKISNPWHKPSKSFGPKSKWFHYWKNIKLSTNKNFEIQLDRFGLTEFFEFSLSLEWNGYDHAGPSIMLSVLGYFIEAKIYDKRHWDYETNDWETSDGQN